MSGIPCAADLKKRPTAEVITLAMIGKTSTASETPSPRENEEIDLLASGYIDRKIADKLDVGKEAVPAYLKNIRLEMHIRSRIEPVVKHQS